MSDVVTRVVQALNAHDIDGFVACYAHDATIEDGFDDVVARGHSGLHVRYGAMFEEHPDARWTVLTRIDSGPFVVQHEEVTGRGDTTRHVAVYLLREGVIARERLLR